MRIKFGQTSISIEAEGCYRCGTLWSSGWYGLKELPVQIGNRKGAITLHICANCASDEEKATVQATMDDQ